MRKQIAQKLFDWIKETGPCPSGDAYSQVRIDEVYDFLGGYTALPFSFDQEEMAFIQEHGSLVGDEVERLLTD